tara:strand:- start:990 stop:1532 length:543 start_codon:yes stop_codon:yes gene_type:complete
VSFAGSEFTVSSFTVRIHGLQSASGQLRNGQQGVAFRDNGNGRVGVRCADGEEISLKLDNLLLSPIAVALPADCTSPLRGYRGADIPPNAASRGAGDFCASDASQPGFFVHRPPSLPGTAIAWAITHQGVGWPGVYTDRRLAGVAEALPAQVAECWLGSGLGLGFGLELASPNPNLSSQY